MRNLIPMLCLAASLTGCGGLITDVMVHAPNKGRAVDAQEPSPEVVLDLFGVEREMFVDVGPPAARLRLWIAEPAREADRVDSEPRGTVLVLHGYRHDSAATAGQANELSQAGYRAVMVDLRGHGGSSGDYITYGARESRDLMRVIDELERRRLIEGRLGVWGESMGASTAIQLAGRDPRVDAVVAVTPYTSMRAVVPGRVRKALPVIGWLMSDEEIQRLVEEAGREAEFDPDRADARRAIQRTDAPVLILGGEWDMITPFEQSEALHAAAPSHTRLVALEWTGHLGAGIDLSGEIGRKSVAWFDRWLGEQAPRSGAEDVQSGDVRSLGRSSGADAAERRAAGGTDAPCENLDEFVGQEHFLGPGKLLRRMLEADRMTSVIFYGPPGVGKTTLAEIIAQHTQRHFERANAATIGVKEVRAVIDGAVRRLTDPSAGPGGGRKTVLFLDEIHRFNRAQQDVLLRDVERGTITLIGATTENPFFAVNSPLISRSQVFQFQPLSEEDVAALLRRAIGDEDRGYGKLDIRIDDEAVAHWATASDGDARRALAALEIAVLSSSKFKVESSKLETEGKIPGGPIVIDRAVAEESIQRKAIDYDPTGDAHYDVISAFIKSMRGSDPDAAVYWLARMIVAGEDPLFIARRIAILASEDIGNADPRALQVAAAAYQVTERIGLPECQLTLAQAAIYMAAAPKSNASATAIWTAVDDVKNQRTLPVPKHLRDGHYAGAKKLGHGEGYQYAHKSEKGWVDQDYLGVDKTYYQPTERGHEQYIRRFLEWLKDREVNDG